MGMGTGRAMLGDPDAEPPSDLVPLLGRIHLDLVGVGTGRGDARRSGLRSTRCRERGDTWAWPSAVFRAWSNMRPGRKFFKDHVIAGQKYH